MYPVIKHNKLVVPDVPLFYFFSASVHIVMYSIKLLGRLNVLICSGDV